MLSADEGSYPVWDSTTGGYYDPRTGQPVASPADVASANAAAGVTIGPGGATSVAPAAAGGSPTPAGPAAPDLNKLLAPDWLTNFLPNGQLPTTQASTIGSVLGITPQNINAPTSANPMQVNPQSVNAATSNLDLSNANLNNQIMSGLMPQFQQQNRALQEQLASAGIMGGQGIGGQAALNMQQQQQALAAMAPLDLQQEGLNLNQSQGNAQNLNQVGLSNAQLGLQGQTTNAANSLQNNQFNASNVLNANTQNAANWLAAQNSNAANNLNMQQYNANALNNTNQYNASNQINTANNMAQQAWQSQALQAQLANSNWLQQFQDQFGINTGQAQAVSQSYQPNFVQPPAVNLGGFAGFIPSKAGSTGGGSTGGGSTGSGTGTGFVPNLAGGNITNV